MRRRKDLVINSLLTIVFTTLCLLLFFVYKERFLNKKIENNENKQEVVLDRIIDNSEYIEKDEVEFQKWINDNYSNKNFYLSCITKNKALSSEEIEVLKTINTFLNEQKVSTEIKKQVCMNTYKLDIYYKSNISDSITGYYENDIIYLNQGKVEDRYFQILGHELFHAISSNSSKNTVGFYQKDTNVGYLLNEGITQLLTEEYYAESPFTIYKDEVVFAKMLLEIVSAKKVLNAYLEGDIEILINDLEKSTAVNREEFLDFVSAIDNYKDSEDGIDKVISSYKILYKKINKKSYSNDKVIKAYLYLLGRSDSLKLEVYDITSYYFSNSLKKEYPYPIVKIKQLVEEKGKTKIKIIEEVIK